MTTVTRLYIKSIWVAFEQPRGVGVGMGQALLQPCVKFVGKIRLWNVYQSGLFKVANGKNPNSNCWGAKRNIWARVTKSAGVHPLPLGLGLGVQQGHPNSLHRPLPIGSAFLYTGRFADRPASCVSPSSTSFPQKL